MAGKLRTVEKRVLILSLVHTGAYLCDFKSLRILITTSDIFHFSAKFGYDFVRSRSNGIRKDTEE